MMTQLLTLDSLLEQLPEEIQEQIQDILAKILKLAGYSVNSNMDSNSIGGVQAPLPAGVSIP